VRLERQLPSLLAGHGISARRIAENLLRRARLSSSPIFLMGRQSPKKSARKTVERSRSRSTSPRKKTRT
jgi:hypothetical protein